MLHTGFQHLFLTVKRDSILQGRDTLKLDVSIWVTSLKTDLAFNNLAEPLSKQCIMKVMWLKFQVLHQKSKHFPNLENRLKCKHFQIFPAALQTSIATHSACLVHAHIQWMHSPEASPSSCCKLCKSETHKHGDISWLSSLHHNKKNKLLHSSSVVFTGIKAKKKTLDLMFFSKCRPRPILSWNVGLNRLN